MKNSDYIHSPLNYIGGKFKLLPQLLPLFPERIGCFVDLFCGGLNVAVNVVADRYVCNDRISQIIDLYKTLRVTPILDVISHIENRIAEYGLSKTNAESLTSPSAGTGRVSTLP